MKDSRYMVVFGALFVFFGFFLGTGLAIVSGFLLMLLGILLSIFCVRKPVEELSLMKRDESTYALMILGVLLVLLRDSFKISGALYPGFIIFYVGLFYYLLDRRNTKHYWAVVVVVAVFLAVLNTVIVLLANL